MRRAVVPAGLFAAAAIAPLAIGQSSDMLNDMVLAAAYVVMGL